MVDNLNKVRSRKMKDVLRYYDQIDLRHFYVEIWTSESTD